MKFISVFYDDTQTLVNMECVYAIKQQVECDDGFYRDVICTDEGEFECIAVNNGSDTWPNSIVEV